METQTITAQEFVNQICMRNGTKIGSLFTRTKLVPGKHLKVAWRNEGNSDIIIIREGRNCMVGVDYQSAVNRQLEREGKEANFVAEERKWGTRIMRDNGKPTPFVSHTPHGSSSPKLYMTITIRWEKEPIYEDSVTGDELSFSEILPYLYNKSDDTRQGTDLTIQPRDYELKNIYGWKYGGVYYEIIHSDTLPIVPTT